MPHITIDYTANLSSMLDIDAMVAALHDAADYWIAIAATLQTLERCRIHRAQTVPGPASGRHGHAEGLGRPVPGRDVLPYRWRHCRIGSGFSRSTKRRLRRRFVDDTDRRSRGGRLDKNRRSGT